MRKFLAALLVAGIAMFGYGAVAAADPPPDNLPDLPKGLDLGQTTTVVSHGTRPPGLPKDFPIPKTATVVWTKGPIPKAGNVDVGLNPHKGTVEKVTRYFLTELRRRRYRVATANTVDDGYGPYGIEIVYGKPRKAMGHISLVRGSDKHQKPELLELLPAVPFEAAGSKPGTVATVHDDQYDPNLEAAFAEIGFQSGVGR